MLFIISQFKGELCNEKQEKIGVRGTKTIFIQNKL